MTRLFFLLLVFFVALPAWSHQFLPTETTLTLLSKEEYVLSTELDVIELMQQHYEINGTSDSIIAEVRALSRDQVEQALKQTKIRVLDKMAINIDGSSQKLEKFVLPPSGYVMRLLKNPPQNTEYRISGVSRGKLPKNSQNVRLRFPPEWGTIKLNIVRSASLLVPPGGESLPIRLGASKKKQENAWQHVFSYLYQGILHIIPKGLDHILFVLALFFLSRNMKILLWQVTVFTVAHTITLFLASYQIVNVPAKIVEPLIALSIALVALENLFHNNLKPWRIGIVFVFGLLHGLGFASVLLDLGLSAQWAFLSLVSFNIGVEIGQLIVVAAAFLMVGWFNQKSWYRNRIVLPSSGAIALVGLFWTFERIFS